MAATVHEVETRLLVFFTIVYARGLRPSSLVVQKNEPRTEKKNVLVVGGNRETPHTPRLKGPRPSSFKKNEPRNEKKNVLL
jgi:hypothetical protein